jgi:hypothetical protein
MYCQADSTSSRRARLDPVLVIDPCVAVSPDWFSDGVRPSHAPDLARRAEALPVAAELEMHGQRGQGVDPAKAPQPGDGRPDPIVEREPAEALVEHLAPSEQPIQRGERVDERQLGRLVLEGLAGQPLTVALVPGGRLVPDTAVDEQQLRDAVPGAHHVTADLLAAAREVAHRFQPARRHEHRRQLPRQQQPREQLGVLAVGLDPISRRPGCLARRDNLHLDPGRLGGALKTEPGRPRLISGAHRT